MLNSMPLSLQRLCQALSCLALAIACARADDLQIDGKWMVATTQSSTDPKDQPQQAEPGREIIEIHGATLVVTSHWGMTGPPKVESCTMQVIEKGPSRITAKVTEGTYQPNTWVFTADGQGLVASHPSVIEHLVRFDAAAAAKTAEKDQEWAADFDSTPLPIADRVLSGTLGGAAWTAAHCVRDEEADDDQVIRCDITAVLPPADGDLGDVPRIAIKIPKTTGPFPCPVKDGLIFHPEPGSSITPLRSQLIIYSISDRSISFGLSGRFHKDNEVSGKFTLELPAARKAERIRLDGKWMVVAIESGKPGERSGMKFPPGAMTIEIHGSSMVATTHLSLGGDEAPEAPVKATLAVTANDPGRLQASVFNADGTKDTWVVTAVDTGLRVAYSDQTMRLAPYDEQAVAKAHQLEQDERKPARPIADGVLSGTFGGAAWTAASCIRSRFQMHDDAIACTIAAAAQDPKDFASRLPNIMVDLPRKVGAYPFSGQRNATFYTPPGKNFAAVNGQLVIYSVTDKAIAFGLSARADKDHDVTGKFSCDLAVPVDVIGADDAPSAKAQAGGAHDDAAPEPVPPIADRVLSGTLNGAAWTAVSCVKSDLQLKQDEFTCEIAAVAPKPDEIDAKTPQLIVDIPKKAGSYPLSFSRSVTFFTPPEKNVTAVYGQLVVYSVTDKAITFGLSAKQDKDNDVSGKMTLDVTGPAPDAQK
jgi:hypothetical protein